MGFRFHPKLLRLVSRSLSLDHYVDTSEEFGLCCCGDEGGDAPPFVSFSFLIRNHVLVPRALAKWSSTVWTSGSFLAFRADHMLEPRDLAKWSSTVPVENKISSVSHFLNILRNPLHTYFTKISKRQGGIPIT